VELKTNEESTFMPSPFLKESLKQAIASNDDSTCLPSLLVKTASKEADTCIAALQQRVLDLEKEAVALKLKQETDERRMTNMSDEIDLLRQDRRSLIVESEKMKNTMRRAKNRIIESREGVKKIVDNFSRLINEMDNAATEGSKKRKQC
jgi:hypothetical protein